MSTMKDFSIKIFADGADKKDIIRLDALPYVDGFTTNPTLMRKAGVTDYEGFAKNILQSITHKPFSFEVFADEFQDMEDQAHEIASWGKNVYVKIPIMNTKGVSAIPLIQSLTRAGIPLNVTAIFTLSQVEALAQVITQETPIIVSVFAGRIADTGRDPLPIMQKAHALLAPFPNAALLWASPREIFNLIQADEMGCDIITLPPSLLDKVPFLGKDLKTFSQETVEMFYKDASLSDFSIACKSLTV